MPGSGERTDGADKLSGWTNSAIIAGDGDDVIKVWSDSVVDAGGGNDTVDAWSGSAVDAGAGDDIVRAWSDSHVSGGEGNDRIDIWSGSQADGGAKARISPWANKTLHEFYAPWQRRLRRLLERTNASLLPLEERLLSG